MLTDAVDWTSFAASLFGAATGAETLAYHDVTPADIASPASTGDRLVGALFLAPEPVAVSRDWACEQLSTQHSGQRARMAVIAGRPGFGLVDRGAIVCSCFGVGANQIASRRSAGLPTVAAIGEALKAGTNCGSCRAEIQDHHQ